ncbi:peptide chain release factor N(5)-glutamine methyltransferase [Thermoleptolyngbya oregonensis NK1-22]|uniref:Release factor glutamine methyltransferase n=1 Tax=Thermoleptolyngbya oregonensis NK1-22 TaxID=2547457 RepID=A0AA96Y224_9CYAN|nr:peptide chain release factor N(5)-glutamine methyltransferase [Thermoleptolyngbya oregonensis NK1-22]
MVKETVAGDRLWQWRQLARQAAIAHQVSPAEVDWLLQQGADVDPLLLKLGPPFPPEISLSRSLADLTQLWQARLRDRVPVQYLVGRVPWREFDLAVSPAVLIPRPETELLIDLANSAALQYGWPVQEVSHWADLGTGSGAIALGLASVFPLATVHAVDWSEPALAIARQNAEAAGLGDRIQFHQGSWFEPLAFLAGQLQGIVSNPPYIPTRDLTHLDPEVAVHEPHTALDGGPDGLDCIRHIVHTAPHYLKPGGLLLLEMMAGQAPAVAQLLSNTGQYATVQIHPDLAGIERFAVSVRR